jgi:phage terminase large subunit
VTAALHATDALVLTSLQAAAKRIRSNIRRTRPGKVPRRFRKYINDPVGFFRDELGIDPWSLQAALIGAVGLHDRVLCRSGHKCGKSLACVGLALWWVATRARGHVVLTAPTFHQVKDILWRELTIWYPRLRSKLRGGDLPKDPATGLDLAGGRKIIGISTAKPENLAGISGAELLFIIDEASGFPNELFEVIMGNSGGGAKIVAISNPTRTVGWFFDGFKKGTYDLAPANDNGIPESRWRLLHISSEQSPNIVANDNGALYPGLAEPKWLAWMRDECGPDYENSALYLVRVRGEFPTEATDSVISLKFVTDATARWKGLAPPLTGPLSIGVDVARFGDDETVIQVVRGSYAWEPIILTKADGPTVADAVARAALLHRRGTERVRVNIDGIGVGASVVDSLTRHDARTFMSITDVNVGSGSDDDNHTNLRSQLWFGIGVWLREGGTIPDDDRLTSELLAPTFTFDELGRKKVMSKKAIRQILQRSPDRADALALAVYHADNATVDLLAAYARA